MTDDRRARKPDATQSHGQDPTSFTLLSLTVTGQPSQNKPDCCVQLWLLQCIWSLAGAQSPTAVKYEDPCDSVIILTLLEPPWRTTSIWPQIPFNAPVAHPYWTSISLSRTMAWVTAPQAVLVTDEQDSMATVASPPCHQTRMQII